MSTWPSSPTMTADKTWVWNGTVGQTTYTLDKVGNWADWYNNGSGQETRSHNNVNEITDINGSGTHVGYDTTGNMNKMPKPTDPANHHYACTYDFRNRLVKVETDDQTPKKVAEYFYDGLNRRIRKIVYDTDGTTETSDTRFLYDGWQYIEERNENDSHKLLARYIYGGLYIDEPLRMCRDTDSDGDFADAGDVNVYYLQDRLFNVLALTDTDGAIKERTWYEPYGKPTNRRESDGDEAVASHLGNPLLFCGYRLDAETSSFDVRNRQYQPTLGRWMQRDPAGNGDGTNLYEYVSSRPQAALDPSGYLIIAVEGADDLGAAPLEKTVGELAAQERKWYKDNQPNTEFFNDSGVVYIHKPTGPTWFPIIGSPLVFPDWNGALKKLTSAIDDYARYRQRVEAGGCRKPENLHLVGFSDGATTIALWLKKGQGMPRFKLGTIGLIDLVRTSDQWPDRDSTDNGPYVTDEPPQVPAPGQPVAGVGPNKWKELVIPKDDFAVHYLALANRSPKRYFVAGVSAGHWTGHLAVGWENARWDGYVGHLEFPGLRGVSDMLQNAIKDSLDKLSPKR